MAKVTDTETVYYHKDHLNSSTVVTSAAGAAQSTNSYLPYGVDRAVSGISMGGYKFTDQEHDVESGLYNYDARLYGAQIVVFVSPDNIVPKWYNPGYLNRYAYCLNNPLIYQDPTGHYIPDSRGDHSEPVPLPSPTPKDDDNGNPNNENNKHEDQNYILADNLVKIFQAIKEKRDKVTKVTKAIKATKDTKDAIKANKELEKTTNNPNNLYDICRRTDMSKAQKQEKINEIYLKEKKIERTLFDSY